MIFTSRPKREVVDDVPRVWWMTYSWRITFKLHRTLMTKAYVLGGIERHKQVIYILVQ